MPDAERDERLARIDAFLAAAAPPTPCIVIDLETVRRRHAALAALLPDARIFYAVKANPHPAVIDALAALGTGFDVASAGEIALCRERGVAPERLCFGNTIKREHDIAAAHALGIPRYAFDCAAELEKLARAAPGAGVFCRLAVAGGGADWPLTRKFGCAPEMAADLLLRARALGLRPLGVSFHVGSQQTDPQHWAGAIRNAAQVFRACRRGGLDLALLNLGGGLPAHYLAPVPPLATYVEAIEAALAAAFGGARPALMIEPGRYMVGDAGLLRTEILLVARRGHGGAHRWIYLDAGRFNGLAETLGEHIRYPIRTPRDGEPAEPAVLAGPTCDSADIIYERARYLLPRGLAIGERIDLLGTGAYTASYASVAFNGFPPLAMHCVPPEGDGDGGGA